MTVVGGRGPCIALLEWASIGAGYEATDALVKEASVDVLQSGPITPGKFFVLFSGPVEEVASALRRALEIAPDVLLDHLFIPNVEPTLLALAHGEGTRPRQLDAVGIIETLSIASTIRAADVASKRATLQLLTLRLAAGIGGKSFVTFTGAVDDVAVAVEDGARDAQDAGMLVRRVVIPQPHPAMRAVLGVDA